MEGAVLDYYQAAQDSKIKYEQVVEQFVPPARWTDKVSLRGAAIDRTG